jgi:hypothetical protein
MSKSPIGLNFNLNPAELIENYHKIQESNAKNIDDLYLEHKLLSQAIENEFFNFSFDPSEVFKHTRKYFAVLSSVWDHLLSDRILFSCYEELNGLKTTKFCKFIRQHCCCFCFQNSLSFDFKLGNYAKLNYEITHEAKILSIFLIYLYIIIPLTTDVLTKFDIVEALGNHYMSHRIFNNFDQLRLFEHFALNTCLTIINLFLHLKIDNTQLNPKIFSERLKNMLLRLQEDQVVKLVFPSLRLNISHYLRTLKRSSKNMGDHFSIKTLERLYKPLI